MCYFFLRSNCISNLFRRARFRLQSQPLSTTNNNGHQNLINSDAFNEYQFYTENSVLGAALNRLMSPTSQNTTINSIDETRTTANEGVSIVSAPKNVKFIIPLVRSGLTSNESTFGVIESTTRTITHVKDIFPLNSSLQSQTTTTINNGDDTVTASTSSNSTITSPFFEPERRQDQNEIIKSDSEQQPLLQNNNSNQK
jgi:hypothetical protein